MKRSEQWYVLRGSDRRIYLSKCTCATLKKGQYYGAGTDVAKEIYDDDIGLRVLIVCGDRQCKLLKVINSLDDAVGCLNSTDTFVFGLEDLIFDTLESTRPKRALARKKTSK